MNKPFKAKIHRWENGKLKTFELSFEREEHALEYCKDISASQVKIYNNNNELVHTRISNVKKFPPVY